MNSNSKINSHILDYLRLKCPDFKEEKRGRKNKMILCPVCHHLPLSAQILPNLGYKVYCTICGGDGLYLPDVVKSLEPETKNWDDEKIYSHVRDLLKLEITTDTELDKLLDFYEKNHWSFIRLCPNSKIPVQSEKGWSTKSFYDIHDVQNWLENKANLAINTGKVSNITVLDVDVLSKEIKEDFRTDKLNKKEKDQLLVDREKKLQELKEELPDLGDPLTQETLGGEHWVYQYEEELPNGMIVISNYHLEIKNDKLKFTVEPSTIGNTSRKFKELKNIPKMPQVLKEFLLKNTGPKKERIDDEIKEAIEDDNYKINSEKFDLKNNNLEGCCNTEMIKLGGKIRKNLNAKQTEIVMRIINKNMLEVPMDENSVRGMCQELEKYTNFDETQYAEEILTYLTIKDEPVHERDISLVVLDEQAKGEQKKRLAQALQYLVKEERILQIGRNYYQAIKKPKWETRLVGIGKRVDFQVPYFDEVANFNWGDIVLIGAGPKVGKTHISMNFVKKFVEQNICPDYVGLEPGSGFAEIAMQMGIKEGDFRHCFATQPELFNYDKNKVIIIDWLMPRNFAEVDKLLMRFAEETYRTQSFMIVFMQLKQNEDWFSVNMVKQAPALATKYMYTGEPSDNDYMTWGEFVIEGDIRRPKTRKKYAKIPCKFIYETGELKTLDEIDREEK